MGWDMRTQRPTTTNTCATPPLDWLPTSQSGMNISRLRCSGAGGASPNGEPPTPALTALDLFSTMHQRERNGKLPKCFSLLRVTDRSIKMESSNGSILMKSHMRAEERHTNLLSADMLAWTIATIRAREVFLT